MLWLIALVVGLYGLLGGSFLNALIWRVHEGRSIVKGRSMCPHCHHQLAAADLVPVASWLMLRGKCRYCSKPISLQYPAVELLTGFLFGLSYYGLHPVGLAGWVNFVVWLYFLGSLIFLAVYDLKWLILPNKILLPAVGVALVWLLARFWWLGWSNAALLGPLKAAAVTGAVFFCAGLCGRREVDGDGRRQARHPHGFAARPAQNYSGAFYSLQQRRHRRCRFDSGAPKEAQRSHSVWTVSGSRDSGSLLVRQLAH